MSVNIYLNTVPEKNKGATRILQHQVDYLPGGDRELIVLGKVQPAQGTASVFRETVWHDGEELLAGEKYLLRSDIMFEREGDFDFDQICSGLNWKEKANKALNICYNLQDGGNFLEADEWRARAFELNFFA
jgi:prolyl 4-hydroxylase